MPLTNFDLAAPPTGPQPEITSATFHASIADPVFWQKIHALCVTEFEHGDEADLAWEHFLRAMKGKLSAGEAAKIRDVVGVRGQCFPSLACQGSNSQAWVVVLELNLSYCHYLTSPVSSYLSCRRPSCIPVYLMLIVRPLQRDLHMIA